MGIIIIIAVAIVAKGLLGIVVWVTVYWRSIL